MRLGREIITEEKARQRFERDCARAFNKLAAKIERHTMALEIIGENDMGVLNHDTAGEFHAIVASLRTFSNTLEANTSPREIGGELAPSCQNRSERT